MTLKLRTICLKNWKCYQNQRIEFNTSASKSIYVVFGQNGFGKTSLLEAIQWCLYGSDAIASSTLLEYFNRITVRENPQIELSVQLTFERDKNVYNISRTAKRILRGITASVQVAEPSLQTNGIDKKEVDVRERIEELLPKSCKDFFFFDGVEIKRYAQNIHTEATRTAIEKILGIPELRNLRDDAGRAMQVLDKKLKDAGAANDSLRQQTDNLAEIQDRIETIKEQIQIAKEDWEAANKIHEDAKYRATQIEFLKGKLNDLTRMEREQSRIQENLNIADNEVENTLRQAAIPLLLEFVREVRDDLQSQTISTARRSGSVEQLRALIETDTCICGRCLDEISREHLLNEIEHLKNIGNLTKEALLQDDLRQRLGIVSQFKTPNFEEILLNRDRLEDEMEEVKQAAYRLKKETQDINAEEAAEIWRKVGAAEEMIREKREKIERLQREIDELQQKEERIHREIEKLAGQNQETATIAHQVKLARGLHQAANELIEWRIAERKQTIETYTSKLHCRVTNKPDEYLGVAIEDDYTLRVKNATGELLNPDTLSAGEKESLAFAFIAGLNLASGKAAPLIMDTPFGHLDTDHQKNLINALPELPSQVVLLATDRDLPDRFLQNLRPEIASILKIKRLSATEDGSSVEVEE